MPKVPYWKHWTKVQSNLALRNVLIRNKLISRSHFLWQICHLLHKEKKLLALRNNFRMTKKFLIAKFDCIRILIEKNRWDLGTCRKCVSEHKRNSPIWPPLFLQFTTLTSSMILFFSTAQWSIWWLFVMSPFV